MSLASRDQPGFFHQLTPATQLMVQRRLELGDLAGTDFLMKSESAETRRKYELWKMREGLLEKDIPITVKSGPSRVSMDVWEAERQERRKLLNQILYGGKREKNGPGRAHPPSPAQKKEEIIYESNIRIEIPLTVLIPTENEATTATAVLGLRSDYY